jgi:hypothetical protein
MVSENMEAIVMQFYPDRLYAGVLSIALAVPMFFVVAFICPQIAGFVPVIYLVVGTLLIISSINVEVWDTCYRRL